MARDFALTYKQNKARAKELGAVEYITKPFKINELLILIQLKSLHSQGI